MTMSPKLRDRLIKYAITHRKNPKWKKRLYAVMYNASLRTVNKIK